MWLRWPFEVSFGESGCYTNKNRSGRASVANIKDEVHWEERKTKLDLPSHINNNTAEFSEHLHS